MNMNDIADKIFKNQKNKKYIMFALLCGVLLMLMPTCANKTECDQPRDIEEFSVHDEEERLKEVLSSIQGVGKCEVLLSVHTGTETVFAENEGETVIISNGSSETPVTVMKRFPEYQGAVIVIGGYSDANVRFDILSAVMSYTGLGTDRITICPLEE